MSQHINILTGYIHHIVYSLVMLSTSCTSLPVLILPPYSPPCCSSLPVALSTHQTYVFSLAAFLELPTFMLALSNLAPAYFRHDLVFASIFFLTRILFHSWVCYAFLAEKLGGTGEVGWEACGLLCLALPLYVPFAALPHREPREKPDHEPLKLYRHIHWFKNNVQGMIKRYQIKMSPSLRPQPSPIHGPTTGTWIDPSAPLASI